MQNKSYTEKEIKIFNAVITLLNQGISFYNLKVSDIAVAAGIGKGTVYEYFDTKDDIVIEALVYNMSGMAINFVKALHMQTGFDDMLDTLFNCLNNNINQNSKTLYVLFSSVTKDAWQSYSQKQAELLNLYFSSIQQNLNNILLAGKAEGKLNFTDMQKGEFVLNCILYGYFHSCISGCCPAFTATGTPPISESTLRSYAKQALISALQQ